MAKQLPRYLSQLGSFQAAKTKRIIGKTQAELGKYQLAVVRSQEDSMQGCSSVAAYPREVPV
ncbi:MAG: hypothetical protein Q4D34_02725 [Eggerthellaceae bacterium]|nr:hypothetical protein [Eggerthellaceae bacterium]